MTFWPWPVLAVLILQRLEGCIPAHPPTHPPFLCTCGLLPAWHCCRSHVSLMYRELLKAMKMELSAQAAAQQQATAQLLTQALEAQKQQVSRDGFVRVLSPF